MLPRHVNCCVMSIIIVVLLARFGTDQRTLIQGQVYSGDERWKKDEMLVAKISKFLEVSLSF